VDEKETARRYYVSGAVQGVGYRYFVLRVARELGLVGYARNLGDGRVEVYAVGTGASLASLRIELRRGPGAAEVSGVVEEDAEIEARFAKSFTIEYDA
jgi:acylphosphatase